MSDTAERWRWVPGYEGLYLVSNMGRVMSAPKRTHYGHFMALSEKKTGYVHVCLSRDGEKRSVSVHRLVASAFLPNPASKPEVNHINGDRSDNRVENLEWATRSENEIHAFRVLGKKPNAPWRGTPRRFARLFTDSQVRSIRSDPRSSTEIARQYGVSKTAIRNIKNRKVYLDVD